MRATVNSEGSNVANKKKEKKTKKWLLFFAPCKLLVNININNKNNWNLPQSIWLIPKLQHNMCKMGCLQGPVLPYVPFVVVQIHFGISREIRLKKAPDRSMAANM